MFRSLSILAFLISGQAWACTCASIGVDEAKSSADVVFAGIVRQVTFLDSEEKWEPRILVNFDVAKVWKGHVSKIFTMHTNVEFSSCGGFFRSFLEEGTNLIVYGFGRQAENWKNNTIDGAPNATSLSVVGERNAIEDNELIRDLRDDEIVYTTNICTRTGLVLYAVDDFNELGEFTEYRKLDVEPDPIALDAITWQQNALPDGCGELGNARRWELIDHPPSNSNELISLIEEGSMYRAIPYPRITTYRDYWVSDESGSFGLCRRSVNPEIVCGQATIEFSLLVDDNDPKKRQWKIYSGGVQTYCRLRD